MSQHDRIVDHRPSGTATASCDCPACDAFVWLSAAHARLGETVRLTGSCDGCGNTVYHDCQM